MKAQTRFGKSGLIVVAAALLAPFGAAGAAQDADCRSDPFYNIKSTRGEVFYNCIHHGTPEAVQARGAEGPVRAGAPKLGTASDVERLEEFWNRVGGTNTH